MSRYRGVKRSRTDPDLSTSSSESSDILVAAAPPQPPPSRQRTTAAKMVVTARVVRSNLIIHGAGVADLLRKLNERDFQRDNDEAANRYFTLGRQVGNHPNGHGASSGAGRGISPLGEDDRGPNHKGTYSKKFTLMHPEVKWVHRGQGRYLPTGTLSLGNPSGPTQSPAAPTPQRRAGQTPRQPVRSSLRRRSGDVDDFEDDRDEEELPRSVPQTSPESRRTRGRLSEAQIPTSSELRAARLNRRSQPVFSIEENGDASEASDASDEIESEDDQTKTYGKDYVDAHPDITWRHCGNGFYKKGARLSVAHTSMPTSLPSRRESTRSLVKDESLSHDIDQSRRYHSSELRDFPNEKFRHCGNGWYRIESNPEDSPDDYSTDIDAADMTPLDGKFTKEQMIAYKNKFPDAEFEHRGNGKYVLAEDSPQATQTPAPTSVMSFEDPRQTFDKAYVKAHPSEEFHHAGSGRYRRGPRPVPVRPSEIPSNGESEDVGAGLVNKNYVDAHPNIVFHHRGQGRYAFGPRLVESPAAPTPTPAELEKTASPAFSDSELVDTAYVNAHPDENFHHRGQGRWARGLPVPGSSNKTAVRGPLAHTAKLSRTPSSNAPPAFKYEKIPGLDELLIRSEGPDKFPDLKWVYRGGGKWARRTKEEKRSGQQGSSRASKARNRRLPSDDEDDLEGPQAQLDREAAEAASFIDTPSNGRYPGVKAQRAEPKQRRRAPTKAKANEVSKNSSQKSKTATPKPVRLTLEEDHLSDDNNYPELYIDKWPEPEAEEDNDEAGQLMRELYKPLTSAQIFQDALIKRDVATRPKEVLQALTAHAQEALRKIQDEYLELDKITAPHARIARKPAKGGRLPIEDAIFEDRKEADLYDYSFDARKIGWQDPQGQKIVRDAEGRELRKRRNRSGLDVDPAYATPGSEEVVSGPRRVTKPVSRFDGVTAAVPTRRKRTTTGTTKAAGSMTPDPAFGASTSSAPAITLPGNYVPPATGRWAGHVPKRIRELRGDSMGSAPSSGASTPAAEDPDPIQPALDGNFASRVLTVPPDTPGLTLQEDMPGLRFEDGTLAGIRKGRPKGSKNLHKRRDAGIPKGPRKPKVMPSIENLINPSSGVDTGTDNSAVMQTEAGAGAGDAMEIDQRSGNATFLA